MANGKASRSLLTRALDSALKSDDGLSPDLDDLEARLKQELGFHTGQGCSVPSSQPFTVDGKSVGAHLISEATIPDILCPLAAWLHGLTSSTQQGRVLIGVVGPAGAGKSVLTSFLCPLLNKLYPQGQDWAVCLSMDGYHYPNTYLDSHRVDGFPMGKDDDPETIPTLRCIKGMPPTINVDQLISDLEQLRQYPEPPEIPLPIYDRGLHDPVRGALRIQRSQRLILVEGLHLLHRSSKWYKVGGLLDYTIFLNVPKEVCRPRVVERKVAGGRPRDSAEAHFDRVDSPIFDRLQMEKASADLELNVNGDGQVTSVKLRGKFMAPLGRPPTTPLASSLRGAIVVEGGLHKVLCIGLNPAVQKVLRVRDLRIGEVNRVAAVSVGIGGKGQNCAHAMSLVPPLGAARLISVALFTGGSTGEDLAHLLEAKGLALVNQPVALTTRMCYTMYDESSHPATVTEVVEPGSQVSKDEQDALLAKIGAYFSSSDVNGEGEDAQGIVFMGTTPPGCEPDFYAKILCKAPVGRHEPLVLVDSVVGLLELLATGRAIHVLKINKKELRVLSEGEGDDTKAMGYHLLSCHPGLHNLAVTDGPDEAFLFQQPSTAGSRVVYRYHIHSTKPILSPIGAGDTCSAVMMAMMVAGFDPAKAFLWGLAAATASCYTTENASFTWDDVKGLAAQGIKVRAQWHNA